MSSVDVIVPCYNYGRYLRQCVESVLTQEGVDVRVLIIDDASTDDSAEVATALAAQDPRVTFVRHPVNKGHIATYNEGIDWISADYYLLLSSDDYLVPFAFSRAVHVLDKHPEVGLVFGRAYELVDDEPIPQTAWAREAPYQIKTGLQFMEYSGPDNRVPTPTAVVRTRLQKRLGGYKHQLPHAGDMEMWLRLASYSDVGILMSYQAVQRKHSCNMSKQYVANNNLPDLQQRLEALNALASLSSDTVYDGSSLVEPFQHLLALRAVSYASGSFNLGDRQASEALLSFALNLSPRTVRTLPYLKLQFKRLLGRQISNVIRQAVAVGQLDQ